MKQTLIYTALPHTRTQEDGADTLKLSVTVSIRLEPNSPTTLQAFEDMLEWTTKVKSAQYKIRFNNNEVDAQLLDSKIDDELWQQLMHDKIKVKAFETEDLTKHRVMSYPAKHVSDFVLQNYQRIAINNPTGAVPQEEFLDTANLGAISRYRPMDEKEYESLKDQPRRGELSESEIFGKLRLDRRILERRLKVDQNTRYIPFQPQQSPATDFLQLRDFHQVDKKPLETPPPKLSKPEFEFHDVLSIVSSYPQIQRKLALVLDFEIPYDNSIPDSGVMHLIPEGFTWSDPADISCPKVSYRISSNQFYVQSGSGSIIDQGFVKVNTPQFTVMQIDADGAALKLNNEVENKIIEDTKWKIININLQGSKTLKAKNLPEEKPEPAGLPALRSAGIALARNGLAEALHMRFQQAIALPNKLLNPAKLNPGFNIILPSDSDALKADDVVQGYRMDIALIQDPDKWYSLHWKKDDYTYFDSGNQSHSIDNIEPDEGFIQIAAAEDTDGQNQLFTGEVMFRWEGWSLSVKKPGYAINEEDDEHDKDYVNTSKTVEAQKYVLDKDLEFKLNAIPQIVKGTLPKLRFGQSYKIRVRTVDMAGNSVALTEETPNRSENEIRMVTYRRYDPVASPIILLGNHLRDGESLEHMVIRSNYDQGAEDYEEKHPLDAQIFDHKATRHLLPPKNSQLMAETHGKFDAAFGSNPQVAKEMYDFITSRESHFDFGNNGKDKVYQESEVEVIYLPDPMGAGISLFLAEDCENTHSQDFDPRMFSFFSNDELTGKDTNIKIGDDWHSGKSIRIRLEEGETGTKWNASERMLTIFMPKGRRTRLKFSTWWREDDIEQISAIWQLLKDENPGNLKDLKALAINGKHWMISPSRELELVHAVQQPVKAPDIEKMRSTREYGETSAFIHTHIAVHGNSTLKIDLQSNWKEPIDLPHHVAPEWVDKSGEVNDISVDYPMELIKKGTFPEKQVKKTLQKKDGPLLVQAVRLDQAALIQQFPDTKHRKVNYIAIGTTRYQEYFDQLIKHYQLPVTRSSEVFEQVIIPSSARPAKPEVEYIIPTFEWRKSSTSTVMRHRRMGGGLRIYLKRPWYSSGEGEQLAVIIPGKGSPQSLTSIMAKPGTGLNPFLTHWGVDPIKLSRPEDRFYPTAEQFRIDPHIDENVAYPGSTSYKVTAVAHPVKFDQKRKLWYCDMAIEHGTMYFPFIKLALARYQEHSVRANDTDVCLSEIVQPDFVQLVPERVCTIDFKKDDINTKFTITIEGVMSLIGRAYSPSNYIVISFLNSELAQPKHMVIDDDTNDKDLVKERVTIHITEKEINNDRFRISREFKLPRQYKREPFIVLIEEYEKATKDQTGDITQLKAVEGRENQPRLVFADRFDVNAPEEE